MRIYFRPLPWDYGVRNLTRRPGRSVVTMLALGTVVLLVLVVVSFVRGLEASLAAGGDPRVALVHSLGASENIENSTMPGRSPALLSASLAKIESRFGERYVSPELYLGTEVQTAGRSEPALGLARGVTPAAPLVRRQFQLLSGRWPRSGEVLAGRLAAAKLGRDPSDLEPGKSLRFESREWQVCGVFACGGSTLESELWCPVEDLQQAMKRQDLSLVAVALTDRAGHADLAEFCKERLDLEWQVTEETAHYAALQRHYGPVRTVAWLIVALVAGAGVFAGMNTMYGAVVGRVRELAMLQTLGFSRRAIALSIVQEGTLMAATGSLIAAAIGFALVQGVAVRFTMGAFTLRLDSTALLVGLLTGILIGVAGSLPPAWRALRMPVVDALKAI